MSMASAGGVSHCGKWFRTIVAAVSPSSTRGRSSVPPLRSGCAKDGLAHLRASFTLGRVPHISSDRIGAYIQHRQQEQTAPATIRYELACLRRAFNLAVRAGKATHRPDVSGVSVDNALKGFVETSP
jgi:hypothetical protein